MPRTTRRKFLQTATATGVGFWVAGGLAPRRSLAANEEVRFACIGVGGKGRSDSQDAYRAGKIVAICDVDQGTREKAAVAFKDAKQYSDWRKMFDEMDKEIDAVTVSTPDHSHAPASIRAMKMGKHCFTQKPLTHTIYEARRMRRSRQGDGSCHADGQPGHGQQRSASGRGLCPGWQVG